MYSFSLDPKEYVTRMAGFSLYVSNTTSKDQGYLCYKDETQGSPLVNQIIPCSIFGRYVIYFNKRWKEGNPSHFSEYAQNELCEVQVYGRLKQTTIFICQKCFILCFYWPLIFVRMSWELWRWLSPCVPATLSEWTVQHRLRSLFWLQSRI